MSNPVALTASDSGNIYRYVVHSHSYFGAVRKSFCTCAQIALLFLLRRKVAFTFHSQQNRFQLFSSPTVLTTFYLLTTVSQSRTTAAKSNKGYKGLYYNAIVHRGPTRSSSLSGRVRTVKHQSAVTVTVAADSTSHADGCHIEGCRPTAVTRQPSNAESFDRSATYCCRQTA